MATENEKILPTGMKRHLRLKDDDCDFIFDDEYQPNINSDEITELYYEGYIEVCVKAGTDEAKIKEYVHGEAMGLLGDVIQDVHKLGLGCDSFDCSAIIRIFPSKTMSWGYRLYQSILKLFQLNGKDSDSVYDITNEYKGYKEGSYGDDKKHGDQGVHYEVYSDKHLGNDGDEIKEFGLDLDNFIVGPEIIRTNNPHYSL